jgi:alkylhydroperoxidase/carboxymuconolactone decarboxylase family protein YurZ
MHWGTGALMGALRGVWAVVGLRGVPAHVAHTVVRLATDQTLENATGVGAPPPTWPRGERVADYVHKAIYAVATGIVAERMIAPKLESRRGTTSH